MPRAVPDPVPDATASRLAGRVVLITGAASGIGRETARRAAREGADIAAIGLDGDALDGLVDEIKAMGRRAAARRADVSDAGAITEAVDTLVVNSGPSTSRTPTPACSSPSRRSRISISTCGTGSWLWT